VFVFFKKPPARITLLFRKNVFFKIRLQVRRQSAMYSRHVLCNVYFQNYIYIYIYTVSDREKKSCAEFSLVKYGFETIFFYVLFSAEKKPSVFNVLTPRHSESISPNNVVYAFTIYNFEKTITF